jgi:hypothetical protein
VLTTGYSLREIMTLGPTIDVPNAGRALALQRAQERFPNPHHWLIKKSKIP